MASRLVVTVEWRRFREWRPAAAEFIATFLFVFIGAGSVVVTANLIGGLDPSRLLAIAFAHGLTIALLVAATAHISGGHINPAVTVGAILAKKISPEQGVLYVVAQLAGGICGALFLAGVIPEVMGGGLNNGGLGAHALAGPVAPFEGLLIEVVLTALLVFVVFGAAMDKRGVGNLAPLAIGLVVVVDHLVGVPLTGASMNPARSLGPAVAAGVWTDHWIYWIGPLSGGIIAALVYKYIFEPKE